MKLEMKKVRYSSRYGYSVEWHEPSSIRLNALEALYLVAAFQNELSAKEMEDNFAWDECDVIYRYQEKLWVKLRMNLDEEENRAPSYKVLQSEITQQMQWFLAHLNLSFGDYLKECLGWPALDQGQIKIDKAFKEALRANRFDKAHYEQLLKQFGMPSPNVLAQVEARVGMWVHETKREGSP